MLLAKRQSGASLVIATFVLVVLGLLAAVMINLLSAGSESVAREVLSTRALFTAESGAQAKLNQIFVGGGNCTTTDPAITGIAGCSASIVACSSVLVNGVNYYTISSEGRCGPASEQAVRIIEVQAKDG
jgi:MSHA biogenesis protein MshP